MRRRIVLGGLLMAGVLSIAVAAQQQAPPKPSASAIKVEKLADNLYILNALAAGGGGNTSIFITATGVVVDTNDVHAFRSSVAAIAKKTNARLIEVLPLDDDLESVFRYLVGAS